MRVLRLASILALTMGAGRALAFHSGGVGACDGCHTMHQKLDGNSSGPTLLQGSDASSTCLVCHGGTSPGGYQVFTTSNVIGIPPGNYGPAGDFAWLNKSYNWVGPKGLETSLGERHGHNVVAVDYGLYSDSTLTTAPGGTYPSDKLSCISCHEPHGKYRVNSDGTVGTTGTPIIASGTYGGINLQLPTPSTSVGAYRMLAGLGYVPRSASTLVPFSVNPPVALSPSAWNRSERVTETRVAYGAGMSEWCANCHGGIHTSSQTNATSTYRHASGASALLGAGGELNIYNQYLRTGVLTGSQATAYTSIVPYEEGLVDRTRLAAHAVTDGSVTSGPTTGQENVMCLTCHRAHATGWDHALRWNMPTNSTIVFGGSWPGIDAVGDAGLAANAQGRTVAETRAAMYDRDPTVYAPFQKVLCNKCHAQD